MDATTHINRSDVHHFATQLAERKAVRVNQELFQQFITFRLGSLPSVRFKTIKRWVSDYDQQFNFGDLTQWQAKATF